MQKINHHKKEITMMKKIKFRPELKLQQENCFEWIISFPGHETRVLLKHSSFYFILYLIFLMYCNLL